MVTGRAPFERPCQINGCYWLFSCTHQCNNTCHLFGFLQENVDDCGDDCKKMVDGSIEAANNYCRNPGGKTERPWCFTYLGTWDYCAVPQCSRGTGKKIAAHAKIQLKIVMVDTGRELHLQAKWLFVMG